MSDDPNRSLISMSLRRVKKGSGSYHVRPGQTWTQTAPDLLTILEGLPILIIGGLATRLYMPERSTLDVDILVRAEDLHRAGEVLKKAGARFEGELFISENAWRLKGGQYCDVIASEDLWAQEAFANPRKGLDGQPCIDLPWLVLLKLNASRTQDLADVTRMLGVASEEDRERVRSAVKTYRPQDLDDLQSLVKLGKLESGS